jgi:hypothetical protein
VELSSLDLLVATPLLMDIAILLRLREKRKQGKKKSSMS